MVLTLILIKKTTFCPGTIHNMYYIYMFWDALSQDEMSPDPTFKGVRQNKVPADSDDENYAPMKINNCKFGDQLQPCKCHLIVDELAFSSGWSQLHVHFS